MNKSLKISMEELGKFLFDERRTPLKWIALLPGIIALFFTGHAFEDAGLLGAMPYIAIVAVSIAYIGRPRVILWLLLFGSFAFFAGLIAFKTEQGMGNEGFLIGLIPAFLMLLAWPMKIKI